MYTTKQIIKDTSFISNRAHAIININNICRVNASIFMRVRAWTDKHTDKPKSETLFNDVRK